MRVVAVGDNCIDYYPKIERWYPTGNCVDFAVNLRTMGTKVAIVSATGTDRYGDSMVALLADKQVEATHLHRLPGTTAVAQMDLVGESGRDRLHVSFDEGVLAQFDLTLEDLRYIECFDIVHSLSNGFINHHIPAIKAMGKTIVYDFSQNWFFPGVEKVIPCVDYGFFSYKQKTAYVRVHLEKMCANGMKVAIATLGEQGSIAFDGKQYYRYGCAPIARLENTVGAGDAYIAGFTWGLTQSYAIPVCMEAGAKLAARIVQVFEPYEEYHPL